MKLRRRPVDPQALQQLEQAGLAPPLARVLAARGIRSASELDNDLQALLRPDALRGLANAAQRLTEAIIRGERICIVGDYDCDGATATVVMLEGLRRLGAHIDYLVPNRFADGYGLSPGVVAAAARHPRLGKPDWIVTVDNGIASLAGVNAAHAADMRVIVTDHHLPGEQLPAAEAIVNPNQPGCEFPSRHLAGVGVAFYVVAAVRAQIRAAGQPAPPLADLLDLVALGTIADLVPLDQNNRRLVAAGLARIRTGKARPGIIALCQVAGVLPHRLTVRDFGFALAPRINAAGRLEDISIGIECLLAGSSAVALPLAETLDQINRQRREIEADMRARALEVVAEPAPGRHSLVVHDPDWHEGIVGLVAGRLKDRFHRPCFAFAPANGSAAGEPAMLRGSGRSLPGIHLRDALALLDARQPGLIERFGGHALAAGLSLPATGLAAFEAGIETAVRELAAPDALDPALLTDGPLAGADLTLALANALELHIWGQGFPPPLFCNTFRVLSQRVVGGGHLKLELALEQQRIEGIFFQRDTPLPDQASLAYALQVNEFRGHARVQAVVQAEGEPV